MIKDKKVKGVFLVRKGVGFESKYREEEGSDCSYAHVTSEKQDVTDDTGNRRHH